MARKKVPFNAWETMNENGIEKRYFREGVTQMMHPVMYELTHSAFHVYFYMKLESGGNKEFKFPKSKWRKFISPNGFQKAKRELIKYGLINELECNKVIKKPNVYEFSSRWKTISIQ